MRPGVVARKISRVVRKEKCSSVPLLLVEGLGSDFFDEVICCPNAGKASSSSSGRETSTGGGGVGAVGTGSASFFFLLRLDFCFGAVEGGAGGGMSLVDETILVTEVERGFAEDGRGVGEDSFDC